MAHRNIIPIGPQHPVLPEPIHFDLVTEDEKVIDAIPSISYVHRGLERLVEKRDFIDFAHVADRICGLCSFMHCLGYCQAVEEIMGIEVPQRALYLRTIWAELSRIHSHIFWLGVAADAFGFESLFMQALRLREPVLDIFEETTGARVILGVCKVGGVRTGHRCRQPEGDRQPIGRPEEGPGRTQQRLHQRLLRAAQAVGGRLHFPGRCLYARLCRAHGPGKRP